MSQSGRLRVTQGVLPPMVPIQFTTDSGIAIPALGNLNVFGDVVAAGTTPIETTGVGNTLTINVQTSQALAAADATKIGFSNFSSTDFAVTATGFVTLNTTGAGKTITGDSGGALSPTANNWNILGSGSITTSGAVSTLTVQLTGLTNHAVLVGAGSSTITKVGPTATAGQVLQSAGAAADPAFSTATYPLTTTINQILFSSAANTVTGLATANRAVLTTGATGIPILTALATDGQLIIGSTAGVPSAATLTAGTGISITNGSNSISIAVNGAVVGQTLTGDSGGALSPTAGNWNILGGPGVIVSGSGSTLTVNSIVFTDTTAATLAVDNGYFATAAGNYPMPATAVQGELVVVFCDTAGAVVLDCPAANFIRIGNQITSSGGTATSTAQGDSLTLRYRLSSLTWCAVGVTGNWTIS
jgi:trimeric autotransporter adhesin